MVSFFNGSGGGEAAPRTIKKLINHYDTVFPVKSGLHDKVAPL